MVSPWILLIYSDYKIVDASEKVTERPPNISQRLLKRRLGATFGPVLSWLAFEPASFSAVTGHERGVEI